MFTPGDYVAASGDVPVAPPPRMSKTLRSFEASAEVTQVIAELASPPAPQSDDQPLEKTLPLALAIRLAAQVPPASPDPPAPLASTPPARMPEPPPRKRVAVFVFLAGLAALLVSGLLAWFVVRSLRP
jgi:hypothetical protein